MILDLIAQFADPIFTIGVWIMNANLYAMWRDEETSIAFAQGFTYSMIVFTWAITFVALDLPLSAVTNGVNAALWLTLAVQE